MRAVMIAVLAAWVGCTAARAADAVSPTDAAEIGRIITAQIAAFRKDDGPAAFAFAAPGVQAKFGDSAHFLAAVQQAYPQVYRPRSFALGAASTNDGAVTQRVEIIGPDGLPVTAVYDLEHEPDGSWRISGCTLLKGALQSA